MKLRTGYALGTLVPCLALSPVASALTMQFNNGSGSYVSGGVTGTATTTGGGLFYNGVENAIGVGSNVFNGALAQGESLTINFDQTVTVNTLYFRQWEKPRPVYL